MPRNTLLSKKWVHAFAWCEEVENNYIISPDEQPITTVSFIIDKRIILHNQFRVREGCLVKLINADNFFIEIVVASGKTLCPKVKTTSRIWHECNVKVIRVRQGDFGGYLRMIQLHAWQYICPRYYLKSLHRLHDNFEFQTLFRHVQPTFGGVSDAPHI